MRHSEYKGNYTWFGDIHSPTQGLANYGQLATSSPLCFCATHKQELFLHLQFALKIKRIFCDMKMIGNSTLQVHTVESDEHSTFICLHTVCGCFPAATAELNSCSRDCVARRA